MAEPLRFSPEFERLCAENRVELGFGTFENTDPPSDTRDTDPVQAIAHDTMRARDDAPTDIDGL